MGPMLLLLLPPPAPPAPPCLVHPCRPVFFNMRTRICCHALSSWYMPGYLRHFLPILPLLGPLFSGASWVPWSPVRLLRGRPGDNLLRSYDRSADEVGPWALFCCYCCLLWRRQRHLLWCILAAACSQPYGRGIVAPLYRYASFQGFRGIYYFFFHCRDL